VEVLNNAQLREPLSALGDFLEAGGLKASIILAGDVTLALLGSCWLHIQTYISGYSPGTPRRAKPTFKIEEQQA
jgi:hypothetical protein